MIEIVPSNWMREYLKNKKEFTDWEKATLIWNAPNATWREIISSLKELADCTNDDMLRKQITERIEYERKALMLFGANFDKEYVYVVLDVDRDACGFFADAEMAKKYGIKNAKQWREKSFSVKKQFIISNFDDSYTGKEASGIRYNDDGDILSIYSYEMSNEEDDIVDEQNKDRFEFQFFHIPFGMEAGTIVRMLNNGEYAVLAGGEVKWNEYMDRLGKNIRLYDFSDVQTLVYILRNDGSWRHEHVNPLFLEVEMPEVEEGYMNSEAYKGALCALGEYMKNSTIENERKALNASRSYAEAYGDCGDPSQVHIANHIEDIMS